MPNFTGLLGIAPQGLLGEQSPGLLGAGIGQTAAPPTYAQKIAAALRNMPYAIAQGLQGNAVGTADPQNAVTDMARQNWWRGSVMGMPEDVKQRNMARAMDVGLAGMMAGPGAKTADLTALKQAQAMESSGVPREAIWSKTGWFKGPEGKWKFEIDDSKAAMESGGKFFGHKGGGGKISDVLEHKPLLDAYPNVGKISAKYNFEAPYQGGAFYENGNYLTVESPKGLADSKTVTLHEIQHAIQRKEGFAKGGSADQMEREYNNAMARLKFLEKEPDYIEGSKKIDDLWESVFSKGTMTDGQAIAAEQRILSQFPSLNESRQVMKSIKSLSGDYQHPAFIGLDAYKRLAGEAEARAVQSRMNMNQAQRQATPPWLSYDIPWDKLIVR